MKRVANHAVRCRHGEAYSAAVPAEVTAAAESCAEAEPARLTGIHATRASTAGTAHSASAPGQPIAADSGSLVDEAASAPPTRPAVYRPVAGPIRSGKRPFTSPGSSAPPIAMPTPARVAPP